jgi:glycosyltransferase involved in cell wall biosynthesis
MQSSRRFGEKEKELSLFQIDAGREWKGEQSRSFFIAKELARRGYPFQFVVQPESSLQKKAFEAGLPVLPVKISRRGNFLSILRLSRAMKREKCRLVHFHDDLSVAVGSAAASFAKVALRVASGPEDLSRKTDNLFQQKYIRDIDAIIASSEDAERDLVDGGLNSLPIEVIPFGMDFSPYQDSAAKDYLGQELSFDPDDFLVGIVAPLSDQKMIKYLIRATRYLREHSSRMKVVILGEGALSIDLEKEFNEIEGEELAFFLGYKDDSPRVFNSLDVLVCAAGLESLNRGLVEAMVCRLPVVFTRVGEIPKAVKHRKTGLIVSPRSPKILANAVVRLFEDRDLAGHLAQQAYEFVFTQFSAEAMASRTIDMYESLAKKRGVRLG